MDDRVSVELVHGGHDALLEFKFGRDSNVTQHGACELGDVHPGHKMLD